MKSDRVRDTMRALFEAAPALNEERIEDRFFDYGFACYLDGVRDARIIRGELAESVEPDLESVWRDRYLARSLIADVRAAMSGGSSGGPKGSPS